MDFLLLLLYITAFMLTVYYTAKTVIHVSDKVTPCSETRKTGRIALGCLILTAILGILAYV